MEILVLIEFDKKKTFLMQLSKIGNRKALLTFVLPRFGQDALHSSSYWTWYVCVRAQADGSSGWMACMAIFPTF